MIAYILPQPNLDHSAQLWWNHRYLKATTSMNSVSICNTKQEVLNEKVDRALESLMQKWLAEEIGYGKKLVYRMMRQLSYWSGSRS